MSMSSVGIKEEEKEKGKENFKMGTKLIEETGRRKISKFEQLFIFNFF